MDKQQFTAVILAGGENKRFNGQNKAFIQCKGRRIIDHQWEVLKDRFDEKIIVTNDPLRYLDWDAKIVTDIFPYRSSLTGIHAGLFYTSYPYAFFTACDAPFLNGDLVDLLLEAVDGRIDIVVPETRIGIEPLCAIYSKRCLSHAERHLNQKKLPIRSLYRKLKVKMIPEKRLRLTDPHLHSFFNINTPEDLTKAESLEDTIR